MGSIRQYRKKIRSAKNIAKLTHAMQLVAASKMRKAQEAVAGGKGYSDGIIELLLIFSNFPEIYPHPLMQTVSQGKDLIVLVAPEKGLCGSLVTNLTKKTLEVLTKVKNKEFISIGKKAKLIVKRLGGDEIAEFELGLSFPKFELVPPIARVIEERFMGGFAKSVTFIYSEFVNTMTQVPVEKVLLPLRLVLSGKEKNDEIYENYLFEPSAREIIDPFLAMYLEMQIYQILLESYASEQSARIVAMRNATDNATNLITALSLEYNKARQTAITNEILDIGNSMGIRQTETV